MPKVRCSPVVEGEYGRGYIRRVAGASESSMTTMPSDIGRLAGEILRDPLRVEVAPASSKEALAAAQSATRLDHALTGLSRDGDGRAWAYLAAEIGFGSAAIASAIRRVDGNPTFVR